MGPSRLPDEPLTGAHKALVAGTQRLYEQALFHVLNSVSKRIESTQPDAASARLVLAGGCALNSVANGTISAATAFQEVFVPPAPGDAGGAVGAAYLTAVELDPKCRPQPMRSPYLGPSSSGDELESLLQRQALALHAGAIRCSRPHPKDLYPLVAQALADGAVVGWFQGRAEWGARALGNRSLLAEPRRADMRRTLSAKIKLRETFRPFAPSVLASQAHEWFEIAGEVPYRSSVVSVLPCCRARIPAVVHADGTFRLPACKR